MQFQCSSEAFLYFPTQLLQFWGCGDVTRDVNGQSVRTLETTSGDFHTGGWVDNPTVVSFDETWWTLQQIWWRLWTERIQFNYSLSSQFQLQFKLHLSQVYCALKTINVYLITGNYRVQHDGKTYFILTLRDDLYWLIYMKIIYHFINLMNFVNFLDMPEFLKIYLWIRSYKFKTEF